MAAHRLIEQQSRTERERQQHENLKQRARELRDSEAIAVGIKEPESFPVILVPSFTAPLITVPECRRQALHDQIARLIAQANAERSTAAPVERAKEVGPVPAATPAAQAILGKACTHCQGNCCRNGGDHAYLTIATIHRRLNSAADRLPHELLEAYLDRIPDRTYENSCIYHSSNGCTLPTDMRSDQCNQFFCDGLSEFLRDFPNPVRGFLASTTNAALRSTAFIDTTDGRPVTPAS